jgi:hypothetical protein
METQIASALAQFGAAGLIGWMWLTERRHSSARERQLCEAHERLVQERSSVESLLRVIGDNTRALAALEAGQRRLAAVLDAMATREAGVPRAERA